MSLPVIEFAWAVFCREKGNLRTIFEKRRTYVIISARKQAFLEKRILIRTKSSRNGISALHLAAYSGHKEVVELLIADGAALDIKTDQDATALCLTEKGGHAEIAALLREHGAMG